MAKHPPFKQGGVTYQWNDYTNSYYPDNSPSAGVQASNVANRDSIRNHQPATAPTRTPAPPIRSHQLSPLEGEWPKVGAKGSNVMKIQKALVAMGFPVHADGKMGPATLSALQYYNTHRASDGWKPPPNATTVTQHPNGDVTRGSKVNNNPISDNSPSQNGGGAGAGTKTNIPAIPSGNNVGNMISEALANSGAKTYDPSYADTLAGIQFDPQIATAKLAMKRSTADAAQHQHDIGNWYGDVQKSLKTASERNVAGATQAATTIGNVGRDILSSIGGSANQGAQTVGAQSAADAAMQAQLGQSEQQYQNDLAPIYKNEAAGQKVNQTNKDAAAYTDLTQALSSLQGQKGQAKSNALMQIQGMNNDVLNQRLQSLLGIKNSNNSLSQQRFSNALSAQTAAIAAAMSNAQIKYYGAATNATTQGGGGFTPWAKLNPAQKQQLIQAAMGNVVDSTGALQGTPGDARSNVSQYLLGQGYNGIQHPGVGPGQQMTAMINSALAHAQALLQQRQAAAQAAGTQYNGG